MKAFWKSLTLWFNGLIGSLAVFLPDLLTQLPVVQQYIPGNTYKWLFLFAVFGNVLIRFKTNTAVGLKDGPRVRDFT